MDINELLQGVSCRCGRDHTCEIKAVYIERDAAKRRSAAFAKRISKYSIYSVARKDPGRFFA